MIELFIGKPCEWYKFARNYKERVEIESFCRQVLALCDSEFHNERQRLQLEQTAIVERRKREAAMEHGIDEAPGCFIDPNIT